MANPLRAAEWLKSPKGSRHRFDGDDFITDAKGMEAYAAYLLSELERKLREERELCQRQDDPDGAFLAAQEASDVAAFRKRVGRKRK